MRKLLLILVFVNFYSCNSRNLERRKIGENIYCAKFINDLIDGEAQVFDLNNKIVRISNYKNGVKFGQETIFEKNGKIDGIANYENDKLNGKQIGNGPLSDMTQITYYYYGLRCGENSIKLKEKPFMYRFFNLEGGKIFQCDYDSNGIPSQIEQYVKPKSFETFDYSGFKNGTNFFCYFPVPPKFTAKYTLGILDSTGKKSNESVLNHDRIFLDTALDVLPSGYHYFATGTLTNIVDGTTVTLYDYEFR